MQKFEIMEADITDKFEKLREKFSGFENNIMTVERSISDMESYRLKQSIKFKLLQEEVKTLGEVN